MDLFSLVSLRLSTQAKHEQILGEEFEKAYRQTSPDQIEVVKIGKWTDLKPSVIEDTLDRVNAELRDFNKTHLEPRQYQTILSVWWRNNREKVQSWAKKLHDPKADTGGEAGKSSAWKVDSEETKESEGTEGSEETEGSEGTQELEGTKESERTKESKGTEDSAGKNPRRSARQK